MRTGKLDAAYDQFDPAERFRLLVAAQARDDSGETERLWRSCPRYTYSGPDSAFTDCYERGTRLVVAVVAELYAINGKLNVLYGVEPAARAFFAGAADEAQYAAYLITHALHTSVRRAVRRQGGYHRRVLRHLRLALLNEGATLAHAFAAICRDKLEVEPEQLIAAFAAPYLPLFEKFIAVTANSDEVTAIRTELMETWALGD